MASHLLIISNCMNQYIRTYVCNVIICWWTHLFSILVCSAWWICYLSSSSFHILPILDAHLLGHPAAKFDHTDPSSSSWRVFLGKWAGTAGHTAFQGSASEKLIKVVLHFYSKCCTQLSKFLETYQIFWNWSFHIFSGMFVNSMKTISEFSTKIPRNHMEYDQIIIFTTVWSVQKQEQPAGRTYCFGSWLTSVMTLPRPLHAPGGAPGLLHDAEAWALTWSKPPKYTWMVHAPQRMGRVTNLTTMW